jgi:6,7-dimethyl-8-ribityllumazine synthase
VRASAERGSTLPSGAAKGPLPGGVRPELSAGSRQWALVVSRFHEEICAALEEGARGCLLAHGAADSAVLSFRVPGAFELPAGARAVLESGRAEAVVGLGVVVRGETPHFEHVCRAASDGLARLAYESGRPVGFGVLTVDTLDQARQRTGGRQGNKGWEAALAALEMAALLDALAESPQVGFRRMGER